MIRASGPPTPALACRRPSVGVTPSWHTSAVSNVWIDVRQRSFCSGAQTRTAAGKGPERGKRQWCARITGRETSGLFYRDQRFSSTNSSRPGYLGRPCEARSITRNWRKVRNLRRALNGLGFRAPGLQPLGNWAGRHDADEVCPPSRASAAITRHKSRSVFRSQAGARRKPFSVLRLVICLVRPSFPEHARRREYSAGRSCPRGTRTRREALLFSTEASWRSTVGCTNSDPRR